MGEGGMALQSSFEKRLDPLDAFGDISVAEPLRQITRGERERVRPAPGQAKPSGFRGLISLAPVPIRFG